MSKLELLWDDIVNYGIATNEELQLITCINGYNEDTLNDVVFVRTGYRELGSYLGEDEDEDEEF